MQTTLTPTAEALLDFVREVLQDLADELLETYPCVDIRLTISTSSAHSGTLTGRRS
ncbi:MAG: hypothetical protein K6T81_12450 [Alicyclobacillus macrosporangiidus]|uniref:hypothetical protein n=1 Tax=Alicyclobacillus macrosporangiidus TaxID=392015 RepID=UPI0026E9B2C9|nr:hypothetical protein [Alicyclobacillus macrosporangiidus]MCL6599534.1 hypothetical protein [Alicyclobacillus macrosporangiidus]